MIRRLSPLVFSSLLLVSAATESYAGTAAIDTRLDARKTRPVGQAVPPPVVPPYAGGVPARRDGVKSCTYRGGPKSHIWECQ